MSNTKKKVKQNNAENMYFLPSEVAVHNTPESCWVSFNGCVYDLTDLCKTWHGTRKIKPILAFAGKDISHWLDESGKDIKTHIHPITGESVSYCPHGVIPDIILPPLISSPKLQSSGPWWLDKKYNKGSLTKNPRLCEILNTLTGSRITIMVCEEDSIKRIQERVFKFNSNIVCYTWKYEGQVLDLDCTLTENGVLDYRDRFIACDLDSEFFIPCLLCYYNADLSEI